LNLCNVCYCLFPPQISTNIALVGVKEPVDVLLNEYVNDAVYQSKIVDIQKDYKFIRRTRPDGNCFFRAYCYSLLEALIVKPELRPAIKQKVVDAKQLLTDAGMTQFTVEDFYENFADVKRHTTSHSNVNSFIVLSF